MLHSHSLAELQLRVALVSGRDVGDFRLRVLVFDLVPPQHFLDNHNPEQHRCASAAVWHRGVPGPWHHDGFMAVAGAGGALDRLHGVRLLPGQLRQPVPGLFVR